MRANFALLMAARITPKNVLPTPGTPRRSRLPALTCRCSFLSYVVGISDNSTMFASALAVSYPTSALLPSARIALWNATASSRSGCTGALIVSYRPRRSCAPGRPSPGGAAGTALGPHELAAEQADFQEVVVRNDVVPGREPGPEHGEPC